MNMFFSIYNGPFVHVFKYAASSDTTEAALAELMEANKPYLGADDGLGHVDHAIIRVVARLSDESIEKSEPTEAEREWLLSRSRRWDPPKPDTAIYDDLG